MYCSGCGQQISGGANFCSSCGLRVDSPAPVNITSTVPPARLPPVVRAIETPFLRAYGGLSSLLALIFLVLVYGIAQDNESAALFLNGVVVNIFDPLVWIIAWPISVKASRDLHLASLLFTAAALLCIAKLYMQHATGDRWMTGSIAGNAIGFIFVGYVINAIAVFRRRRRPAIRSGD